MSVRARGGELQVARCVLAVDIKYVDENLWVSVLIVRKRYKNRKEIIELRGDYRAEARRLRQGAACKKTRLHALEDVLPLALEVRLHKSCDRNKLQHECKHAGGCLRAFLTTAIPEVEDKIAEKAEMAAGGRGEGEVQ